MRSLPQIVRRAPTIFYVAALLFFVWSVTLTFTELNASFAYAEERSPIIRVMIMRGFFQAAVEAVHLAGTGVLAHILLAIWSNGNPTAARGEQE